jgi:hypothetical protein
MSKVPQRNWTGRQWTAGRKRYRGASPAAHTIDFIGISGQSTQWENALGAVKPAKSQPQWLGLGDLGKMIRAGPNRGEGSHDYAIIDSIRNPRT